MSSPDREATRYYWVEELEQSSDQVVKFYEPNELEPNCTQVVKAADYRVLQVRVRELEAELQVTTRIAEGQPDATESALVLALHDRIAELEAKLKIWHDNDDAMLERAEQAEAEIVDMRKARNYQCERADKAEAERDWLREQLRAKDIECASLAATQCEKPYADDYGNSRCETIEALREKLAAVVEALATQGA